jgi:hypothetical protein
MIPTTMSITRKRLLLLAVAVLLSLSALLAIAILLAGRFGSIEGRILLTTALLAGYGLVALPAVVLLDQERLRALAVSGVGLAALAAALALVSVWGRSGSDTVGRTVGSATIVAVALAQVAAMSARRSDLDTVSVRRLFAFSCVTAAGVSAFAVTLLWVAPDGGRAARFVAALLVLDLLLVALQPLLSRARAGSVLRRITVVFASGEQVEVEVRGRDLASAAARAIRSVEPADGTITELKVGQQQAPAASSDAGGRRRERGEVENTTPCSMGQPRGS